MTWIVKRVARARDDADFTLAKDGVRVTFLEKRRVKRDLGFAREVENAGYDHTVVHIAPLRNQPAPFSTERRMVPNRAKIAWNVPLTRDGLRRHVRALRPHEAERLAAIDARLADLDHRVREAMAERAALIREAFENGHVVTVADVRELAEEAFT